MATTSSLGIRLPSGLPYMIAEGYLSSTPSKDQYEWLTYSSSDTTGVTEEEIIFTKKCVVWSQANVVRAIYRFDLEDEDIKQALLTSFPRKTTRAGADDGFDNSSNSRVDTSAEGRALAVLCHTKLHIYHLQGSHQIVNLPFAAHKIFQAPRGLILVRQRTTPRLPSPLHSIPAPPPNSFFSSQATTRASYLQSPTLQKSFAKLGSHVLPTNVIEDKLEELWQNVVDSPIQAEHPSDELIFSLSDPMTEPSLVTEAHRNPVLRLSGRSRAAASIDFDPLDGAESIVYVSAQDELQSSQMVGSTEHGPLLLLVTHNADHGTLTLWHGWYLRERSLQELMKRRSEAKAEKARRRSSFLSASMGTGATTPAVRTRQTLRESFVALSQHTGHSTNTKPPTHIDEAVMTSQLDPDFPLGNTQHSTKEISRRISSQVSRAEPIVKDRTSMLNGPNQSFVKGGPRRGTSFGGRSERRSQGWRSSRGSTPGSVLSRSFGLDDEDVMDVEDESDLDFEDTIADLLQHVKDTHDATGADAFLGSADGSWRRELVVQPLHTLQLDNKSSQDQCEDSADGFKIIVVRHRKDCSKSTDDELTTFIHDRYRGQLHSVILQIKQRQVLPSSGAALLAAIPVVLSSKKENVSGSITSLCHGRTQAVLIGTSLLRFAASSVDCTLSNATAYRMHDPYSTDINSMTDCRETGHNRIVNIPLTLLHTEHSVASRYDLVNANGVHHRQQLHLGPLDDEVEDILHVCELVLPAEYAADIRPAWQTTFQALSADSQALLGTVCSAEAIAATAVVLGRVLGLLDEKHKAALYLARVATNNRQRMQQQALSLSQQSHSARLAIRPQWAALQREERNNATPECTLDQALPIAIAFADNIRVGKHASGHSEDAIIATKLILGLHILSEERKLNTCHPAKSSLLTAIIAQLGLWLNLNTWQSAPGTYHSFDDSSSLCWAFVQSNAYVHTTLDIMDAPIGVFEWLEHSIKHKSAEQYPLLSHVAQLQSTSYLPADFITLSNQRTPRILMLAALLQTTKAVTMTSSAIVEAMFKHGMTISVLESLPEGVATPFREAITRCERDPPTEWHAGLLRLVGRDDLIQHEQVPPPRMLLMPAIASTHDIHTACVMTEMPSPLTKTREADRNAISQLIFQDDRRLVNAAGLLHFNTVQTAECQKQPEWSDAVYFDQQRRVMQYVTIRMIALPTGDGILHFNSQSPLMTERYHLPGFSSSCIMQPMGHTVTTDRSGLTEEKVNWAYFHAGVSAGLKISKQTNSIDTSWLVYNKPGELTNRHAGLLLALGLNGHLKQLAKWLSFKYLTPKHTMTSLGLLLGLAASHLGSMDNLITRMLSVHITCMLPSGAAELNVSPLTQTAGLMAIGLLYYNTQHRRMTETMLCEIESSGPEDPDCGPDALRDESYKLAAGFALGLINLAHSNTLRGLHGLQLQERLLRVAVGARPVHEVHVFDKATAGAIMALTLIHMKSGNAAVARQIDVPDTEAQFEHIRPDILMLRSMAKHIILWSSVEIKTGQTTWIVDNLPRSCQQKWLDLGKKRIMLSSSDLPLYYIVAGLAMAIGLRYAGSGNQAARDEILSAVDILWAVHKSRGDGHYYYDTKVAKAALRRCIDAMALATSAIMSGTGDVQTFRYLRRLHGRTDAETPYGSHLASHMGIGILFMAGGTCTFGSSDLAIASLMSSLYPLFPVDVHDNKVHLQAFRHLWVFAVESRCLVVEDVDSGRPVKMRVNVTLLDNSVKSMQAPCLLPPLESITGIATEDAAYWPVKLDFVNNAQHLQRFKTNHKIVVRRCPASEAHNSMFWATFSTLTTLNDKRERLSQIRDWIFSLSTLSDIEQSDVDLALPVDFQQSVSATDRGCKVDDKLLLLGSARSDDSNRLWDLRVLLAWARRLAVDEQHETRWHGKQVLSVIECMIDERRRQLMAA